MWVSEYIHKRDKYGAFNTLMPAGEKYFQYLRMDVDIFEELEISNQQTN